MSLTLPLRRGGPNCFSACLVASANSRISPVCVAASASKLMVAPSPSPIEARPRHKRLRHCRDPLEA
jgi:hypothetical protein